MWSLSFSDWLISLNILFSRSIQVVAKGKFFLIFLWPHSIPLCKCPIVILPTHRHLGYFHILVIVNNAAMNIGVHMFFHISVLGFFRYFPRGGITGPKDRSIFNFFKYLHTAFHSGYTSLHSHQQCTRIPFSPPHHQHLSVDLLMMGILTGV